MNGSIFGEVHPTYNRPIMVEKWSLDISVGGREAEGGHGRGSLPITSEAEERRKGLTGG